MIKTHPKCPAKWHTAIQRLNLWNDFIFRMDMSFKKVWPLESLPSIFWRDPNLYDFISSVESKRRYFEKNAFMVLVNTREVNGVQCCLVWTPPMTLNSLSTKLKRPSKYLLFFSRKNGVWSLSSKSFKTFKI